MAMIDHAARRSAIAAPSPFISATKPGKLVAMVAPSSIATGRSRGQAQHQEGHGDAMVEPGRRSRRRRAGGRPCPRRSACRPRPRPRRRRRRARRRSAASRSLSLTRSSASPRITVRPSAKAAATARIGYSSIMRRRALGRHRRRLERGSRAPRDRRPARRPRRARFAIGDVGAHLAQRVEEAGAQRVDADALDRDLRARHDQRRHQREGGRGRIARHDEIGGRRARARPRGGCAGRRRRSARPRTVAPKWRSMRSVWSRVGSGSIDRGLAGRVQPGQQHRRLHLRRRHRQRVGDRHRRRRADHAPAAAARRRARRSARPSRASGSATRAHRPAAQRGVAGEERGEADASRRAPISSRAPVPELPRSSTSSGSAKPPTPTPSTRQTPSSPRSTPAPSARIAAAVRSTSSPSSRPAIARAADRQRAQDQRAVRDRLVARHAAACRRAGARCRDERRVTWHAAWERPSLAHRRGAPTRAARRRADFAFDRAALSWQMAALPRCASIGGESVVEAGMGNQAHLPELRHALLRSASRSDRLPEMRHASSIPRRC